MIIKTKSMGAIIASIFVVASFFSGGCNLQQKHSLVLSDINRKGKAGIKLYIIDSGHVNIKDMSVFQPGSEPKSAEAPIRCYLIVHPKGLLIWDTGLADSIAKMNEGMDIYGGMATWRLPVKLKTQLEKIGVKPSDIDYLGLSHIHPDHIGNVSYFKDSTLIIHKKEYESIDYNIDYAKQYGFDTTPLMELSNFSSIEKIEGLYDLFNDRSVILVPTPGHSPGHMALYVDLADTGPVILGGDLYQNEDDHKNYVVPSMTEDKKALVESFVVIDELIEQTGAKLWHTHDQQQAKKLDHLPLFYQ